MTHTITLIAGDGIGPEVTEAVVTALQGTGRTFRPAGRHELKGVPGEWMLSTPDDAD